MSTFRKFTSRTSAATLTTALMIAATPLALADAGHGHGPQGGQMTQGDQMMQGGHMMQGDQMNQGGHMMGGHGPMSVDIGHQGKAADVTRTIDIVMQDNFFEPEEIDIKAGETVRFKIVNKGTLLHEFGLGTAAMHAAHQKEMMVMMEHGMIEADRINPERMMMDHGPGMAPMNHQHGAESGSVLVEPGKSAEMIWAFPKDATLEFACNVPGHYESGMMGPIRIK